MFCFKTDLTTLLGGKLEMCILTRLSKHVFDVLLVSVDNFPNSKVWLVFIL